MFGTSALQAKLVKLVKPMKPMKLVKPSLIETVGCWQQSLLVGHIFAAVNDNLLILNVLKPKQLPRSLIHAYAILTTSFLSFLRVFIIELSFSSQAPVLSFLIWAPAVLKQGVRSNFATKWHHSTNLDDALLVLFLYPLKSKTNFMSLPKARRENSTWQYCSLLWRTNFHQTRNTS